MSENFAVLQQLKKAQVAFFSSVAAIVIIAAGKQLDDKKLEVKNKEDFFYS